MGGIKLMNTPLAHSSDAVLSNLDSRLPDLEKTFDLRRQLSNVDAIFDRVLV